MTLSALPGIARSSSIGHGLGWVASVRPSRDPNAGPDGYVASTGS
jgi:hypothetical protein